MFENMFNGMFKPVASGCCKLGANGQIAIKTSGGYKTFDLAHKRLVNCDNFAFDADGAFWVVPTFSLAKGDIILVNGKPRCVIEVKKDEIKTFSYEDSTVDTVIPEHHVFMGKTYCYGKIFSPFANMLKSDGGLNNMMSMIMMSKMFGGNTSTANNSMFSGMDPMMMMMFMNSGNGSNPMVDMFAGAFDFGNSNIDTDDTNEKEND